MKERIRQAIKWIIEWATGLDLEHWDLDKFAIDIANLQTEAAELSDLQEQVTENTDALQTTDLDELSGRVDDLEELPTKLETIEAWQENLDCLPLESIDRDLAAWVIFADKKLNAAVIRDDEEGG